MAKALLEAPQVSDLELLRPPFYILQFILKTRVLGIRIVHDAINSEQRSWLICKVRSPIGLVDTAFRYDPLQFDPEITDDFTQLIARSILSFAYEYATPTGTKAQ